MCLGNQTSDCKLFISQWLQYSKSTCNNNTSQFLAESRCSLLKRQLSFLLKLPVDASVFIIIIMPVHPPPPPTFKGSMEFSAVPWSYGVWWWLFYHVYIKTFFVFLLAPTQVCISLLSEQDGKRDIVEAAREFCQEIQTKQRALKEMEPDLLNSLLKGNWQKATWLYSVVV